MCWDIVASGLGDRHIYFRYNATSNEVADNTVEQLASKNGIAGYIAVGILLLGLGLCAVELEI